MKHLKVVCRALLHFMYFRKWPQGPECCWVPELLVGIQSKQFKKQSLCSEIVELLLLLLLVLLLFLLR